MITLVRAAAVAALFLLATAADASAGPPGKWTKVTGVDAPDKNTLEVGVARTADGTLHVLWTRDKTILSSQISADAKSVSRPSAVVAYQDSALDRVALIPIAGGVRAFFSGLFPNNPLDQVLATATSSDGKTWAVQSTPASDGGTATHSAVYAASGIGAASTKTGGVFSTWGDSAPGQGGYHAGLSSSDPDTHFGPPCCSGDPDVAVDSVSGQVVLAWNLLGPPTGVFAQSLSPAGGRVSVPGAQAPELLERVGLTGRIGAAGVYVSYLTGTNQFTGRPSIWRFGASKGKVISARLGTSRVQKTTGARFVDVVAAPDGRLWAFWAFQNPVRLFAARSNKAATTFGATASLKPPGGTTGIFSLEGEGSRGPLDLLALVQRSSTDLANWHQRVLPGLTLSATGKRGKATFKVLDAGSPVKGAKVSFAGKSKVSGSNGRATISARPGSHAAKATKTGYAPAQRRIRVK